MPTYDQEPEFRRDYARLSPEQQAAFLRMVTKFVQALRTGEVAAGLRIKSLRGQFGVWEITWGPDGRALFRYGTGPRQGDTHIVWLRVGTHDIFNQ